VNTSQIAENILQEVVSDFASNPTKLLELLNGLFANAIGSTLKGNTTGIQSILAGSGVTLPSGILPSGSSIPTSIPSGIIPSSLPSISISIPTSLPSGLSIPGLTSGSKLRRDADPEPVPEAEVVATHIEERGIYVSDHDLKKRGIISDILGTLNLSTFRNLTDLASAEALANKIIKQFADEIGIYDFYDFHVLKYCLGNYYPTDKANATVKLSDIHRNVTQCQSIQGLDLQSSVENLLNQTGFAGSAGVSLDSIQFPSDLTKYINLAKDLLKALTGLYAVAIGMSFFVMVLSVAAIFVSRDKEVALGTWIWVFSFLGWICAAVASVIVTVAGRLIKNTIKDLNALGISAKIGAGYLGLSWATFACLFIISFLGCFVCCGGRRTRRKNRKHAINKEKGEKDPAYA